MKIKIKRFNKKLPLPEYKSQGAAAFDFTARENITIKPRAIGYVSLNVAIKTPEDHFLILVSRSSTHKKGLMMANGIGIGDPDFSGDGDEYQAVFLNITDLPVKVEKGERIVQGIFVKLEKAQWIETHKMNNKTRGGFGTTGKK